MPVGKHSDFCSRGGVRDEILPVTRDFLPYDRPDQPPTRAAALLCYLCGIQAELSAIEEPGLELRAPSTAGHVTAATSRAVPCKPSRRGRSSVHLPAHERLRRGPWASLRTRLRFPIRSERRAAWGGTPKRQQQQQLQCRSRGSVPRLRRVWRGGSGRECPGSGWTGRARSRLRFLWGLRLVRKVTAIVTFATDVTRVRDWLTSRRSDARLPCCGAVSSTPPSSSALGSL